MGTSCTRRLGGLLGIALGNSDVPGALGWPLQEEQNALGSKEIGRLKNRISDREGETY